MLHTSRLDNTSSALLLLHTAPNCQYKVSVRTSFLKVLGQVLRFCGPVLPVYMAVTLLLSLGVQLGSICRTGRPVGMGEAMSRALRPHALEIPVYLLHLLLRQSWFEEVWVSLGLPAVDGLPLMALENTVQNATVPTEDWPRLLGPVLCLLGATVAFWGSTVMRLGLRLFSLFLAPLHRPSVSRDCGTLLLRTQVFLILALGSLGGVTCGALSVTMAFLLHLYRVLRLQMTERSLRHVLNLAPQKVSPETENGYGVGGCQSRPKECNGAPLLTQSALQEVRDDLQLHLSLSALLTLPMMLCAPSLIHWSRNLRYSVPLDPDPCWPHTLPLLSATVLLINCNTDTLSHSKVLRLTCRLLLPLCIAMVTFSSLHLYRVTHFLSVALGLLAISCYL